MDCREIDELLSAYIDGELTAIEALNVTNHLNICRECRQELFELQATINAIRNLPELEPPMDFHSKLSSRLKSVKHKNPWYKRSGYNQWFGLGAVAAAVILFVVSLNVISPFTSMPMRNAEVLWQKESNIMAEDQAAVEAHGKVEITTGADVTDELEISGVNSTLALNPEEPEMSANALPNEEMDEEKANLNSKERMTAPVVKKASKVRNLPENEAGLADAQDASISLQSAEPEEEGQNSPTNQNAPAAKVGNSEQSNMTPEEKNLSNRNGNYRERQDNEDKSNIMENNIFTETKENFASDTWSVTLKAADFVNAKKELEKLAYANGASVLFSEPAYLEINIPYLGLERTIEVMKKWNLPELPKLVKVNSIQDSQALQVKLDELSQVILFKQRELQTATSGEVIRALERELGILRQELQSLQNRTRDDSKNILLKIYLQN